MKQLRAVNASRVVARSGIVLAGLILAGVVAWIAVVVRQHFTSGPDALASSGMYAFGDMVVGLVVFALAAVVPVALALYWLRPVAGFWSALAAGALLFAASGFLAVTINMAAKGTPSNWMILTFARIGMMPLSAPAILVCACFAPQKRERWLLAAAAGCDIVVFVGVLLVKFILPNLARG